MKFGICTENHMLSSKNAKAAVYGHFPRWPPPPSWKSMKCYKTGKYCRILMKFETQTHNIIPNLKISKPEVITKIQDGRGRHLEFHIICCHFVANCPISTKFCTVVQEKVSQTKNLKPDVNTCIQDGGSRHLGFWKKAITRANINRFWWNLKHILVT